MEQWRTTSERIDNLPLLIHWLKRMQVDVIIDRVLGPPGNNQVKMVRVTRFGLTGETDSGLATGAGAADATGRAVKLARTR